MTTLVDYHEFRIGDQTIDLDGLDLDQQVEAICDAVDVMVDSGHLSGFRYRDRILTNVEMNCFSIWRTQGTRSLFDAWAQQLLTWIGVTDGIDGTENNGTQSTAAG